MTTYTYWDNKKTWHDAVFFVVDAEVITDADATFEKVHGAHPAKLFHISCSIKPHEKLPA